MARRKKGDMGKPEEEIVKEDVQVYEDLPEAVAVEAVAVESVVDDDELVLVKPPEYKTPEPPVPPAPTKMLIKDLPVSESIKTTIVEREMESIVTMKDGMTKSSIMVQYRLSPIEPISQMLIVYNKKLFTDAWEFYKENLSNPKPHEFLELFIRLTGGERMIYRNVQTIRLGE